MCCRLTEVPSLGKPRGTWCQHRDTTGCRIYSDKPAECSSYTCLWLVSPKMGDSLRPDLCGVLFEPYWASGFVAAIADPDKVDCWRHSPVWNMLDRLTMDGYPVVVLSGKNRYHYMPAGMKPEEFMQRLMAHEEKIRDRSGIRN